jgi:putative peptidoglycan lipid II flippase
MVLFLTIPASAMIAFLSVPLTRLIFEHGKFTPYDSFWSSWALRYYLTGLIFAAIDWPLNYAFYARQDTLTPALVGILSVGVYLAVALTLLQPLGMLGLVLADSAKHFSHALTMLILTRRRVGSLAGLRLGQTAAKALLAAGVMTGVMALALNFIGRFADGSGLFGELVVVAVTGGLGVLVYLALISLLRVEEVGSLRLLVRQRLGR